jgi:hypothetical protein
MRSPFKRLSSFQKFFITLSLIFIVAIIDYRTFLKKSEKVELYDEMSSRITSARVSITKLEYLIDMFTIARRFESGTIELIRGDVAAMNENINGLVENPRYSEVWKKDAILAEGMKTIYDDWVTIKAEIKRLNDAMTQDEVMLIHNAVDMNTVLATEKAERLLAALSERRLAVFNESKSLALRTIIGFVLLMLVGSLVLLGSLGRPALRLGALLAGAGFGLFIDEVGKFITEDVDYFYQPAIAIIYATFVVLALVLVALRRLVHLTPRLALANALTLAAQGITEPAANDARHRALALLDEADPSDPRYQNDKGLLNADLREDAKRQIIEKAVGLYVEQGSLAKNYALVRDKLLARSGDFIQAVLEEQPPQLGKDGLMSLATRATVRVRDVQKSLNQMSREERVEFIRNNGDPKISVAITAKSAEGDPAAPAQRSPVAENLLKERIHSFGFRLWNDDMAKDGKGGADFAVTGEAKFRKLSAKLAASGITVEKFVLTSWTVKATDKRSGEEIYYNTQIPEKTSWATEDEALRDIGKLIGEEFSKGFFLSHFHFSGQKVRLRLQGLPNKDTAQTLMHELNGLRGVLAANLSSSSSSEAVFDLELSGGLANPAELVQAGILKPLNHKLGKQCFNAGAGSGAEVVVMLEAGCKDAAVLSRLDTLPPAALIEAPQSRREAVVKNPETLRKISM